MANYSLVVNSKFRPFEYQELVAPVLLATQAHHELEDKYADLATKASIWDGLTEGSEKAHKMYTDYARALEEAADELSRYGLTPTSRQAMLNMWSRYGKEIAPIERAYELRSKDIERQKDAYDKSGGRTIFSRNAREISLDDYLNGASPEYSSVNLDNVVNTGIAGGKAISSRYINTEEGKRFNGDYYSLITETGMSPEQAMEVLRGSGKYPEFERFINDTLTNYGYDKYQGAEKEAIRRALNEGINIGITHSQTENLHENWRAKKAADYYYHELEAEAAANREINKAAQLAQIKAAEDRAKEINTLFNPTIAQGVEGKPDADLDRTKGLRKIVGNNGEIGATTEKLDKLAKKAEEAKKALKDYEDSLDADNLKRFKSYSGSPMAFDSNNQKGTTTFSKWYNAGQSIPKGYTEWQKLHSAADDAKKAFDEEYKYLSNLAKSYSGYGDNMYDRIKTGVAAKQANLGQQKLFFGLNANKSAHEEIREALGRLAVAGATITDMEDNEPIKKSKVKELLVGDSNNKPNTAIGITVGKKGAYVSLNDEKGKEYKVGNIGHIDDLNKRLTFINNRLGDFYSPRTTGNIYVVPNNFEGGWIDVLEAAKKAGKTAHPSGTNMYAATIKYGNDIINVVSDGYNIYQQSISDELYNGGENREQIVKSIGAAALIDLLPTLAHSPRATNEEN